jgi:hypothetical protein
MSSNPNEEEKWEFGSAEWCQFAGELGVRLIEAADLDLSKYEWGFSEIYTHTPERLMAGRDQASYHFMISGGKVSGGAGVPDECLALPGFHVSVPWGAIAHASSFLYDLVGQRARSADERVMWQEIAEATGTPAEGKAAAKPEETKTPRCTVCGSPDHERRDCPVWPPGIGEALSVGASEGGGLHNVTAKRLEPSPEVKDLPQTERGVPVLSKMTDEQKDAFLRLIGRK